MDAAISVSSLHFKYPGQKKNCLQNINLTILKGERFGLFGPNGAGKTTLMSIMTGLIKPATGAAHIFGSKIFGSNSIKKTFGYVPQDFAFYPELTPVENLQFFGAWAGLDNTTTKKRTDELLEVLGLTDFRNKQVKTFSGGMKRRINIAISAIHNPQILFLDEPTVGVDVQTRAAIIDYLKQLNACGTTLVYTSHHLQEAQQLCNHIALIDDGKIIVDGNLEKILSEHNQKRLEDLFLQLTGHAYRD